MAGPPIGPFAMPMMKPSIPKVLQPWIYLLFAVIFQMVHLIYPASLAQMIGTTGMMQEDLMFIFSCGVAGVAMPFPILFRLKFCYTNRSLMIFSVSGMILCILLSLTTDNIPALCVLSYVCSYLKLMATFEAISSIQLWMAPKRDFRVFFPLLYIIVLGDMSLGSIVAQNVTYYTGSWQNMQLLIVGLLILVLLFLIVGTRHFRFMKPIPFVSIDWLGCILWSAVLLELIWIFTYGEYYNWWDGAMWRTVLLALPITFWCAWRRMIHIRHPYLDPRAFTYKTLWAILGMFAVGEMMNATPKVLQNAFTGGVLHYDMMTTTVFSYVSIVGAVTGCLFSLWWMKVLQYKYTRLLTIGFFFMLTYQAMMYFYITPSLNIERMYFPIFILNFGYAIFFCILTLYLNDLMPFHHFFMGLTIAGFIRNGGVDHICTGIYSYLLRFNVADNLASGIPYTPQQSFMMSLKQLYGVTCIGGTFFLLLLMLWHVQPVRSTLRRLPYWNKLGKQMRNELSQAG